MSFSQTSSKVPAHVDENQAKSLTHMPEYISLSKWEDSGFEWQGEVEPVSFERLAALLTSEHEQTNLSLKTNLYRRNDVLHLAFEVDGEVWLTCQRCLQPVATELTDDFDIALLEEDSKSNSVNEEQDYLILEEVVDNQTPERLLPLKKLIEDELILMMPLAPKHDDCEMSIEQFGELPEEEESENPFAALSALKGKL